MYIEHENLIKRHNLKKFAYCENRILQISSTRNFKKIFVLFEILSEQAELIRPTFFGPDIFFF